MYGYSPYINRLFLISFYFSAIFKSPIFLNKCPWLADMIVFQQDSACCFIYFIIYSNFPHHFDVLNLEKSIL